MESRMKKTEVNELVNAMACLLELQPNEQREVVSLIKSYGFEKVFRRVEHFQLSDEVKIKLKDLYCVLQAYDVVGNEENEMEAKSE